MATIRYGDLVSQPGTFAVTGIGSQPGPVGGDGWQVVAKLPAAKLPAGTGRYALVVTGKMGNLQVSGATPSQGVIQVALGLESSGSMNISPIHQQVVSVREQLNAFEGLPFMFVVLQSQSPSISDPFFGATFTNGAGSEWAVFARAYWNGDPTAYAVSFDVTEISWLWFDSDRIPSSDILCEHYYPSAPVALTGAAAGVYVNTNSPGASGQKWLHFHSVTYEPPFGVTAAPSFRFGYSPTPASTTGFVATVGTNGRWGQSRAKTVTGGTEQARLAQGCFWYGVQPVGVFLPACMALDRHSLGGVSATRVHRYTYFGIRLDNLLDVLARTETEVTPATCNLFSATPEFPSNHVALERASTGIVSDPCCLVHGIVQTTGSQAFEAALMTNRFNWLDFLDSCALADAGRQEGVSAMAFAQHGLAASQPDLQYRALFVGGASAPAIGLAVRDLTIVQFNLVRDPEFLPVEPGTPGNPIVLVPGKESADPASLLPLPWPPDSDVPEDPALASERINGGTGYVRTWPLFARVRRMWTLSWGRLSEANGQTLLTFLETNVAFRFTPPRGAAVAAVQIELPELEQGEGQVYSLRVRIVELLWTGV